MRFDFVPKMFWLCVTEIVFWFYTKVFDGCFLVYELAAVKNSNFFLKFCGGESFGDSFFLVFVDINVTIASYIRDLFLDIII